MTETVVVPREATREQQLAMQRALLDNWPGVYEGEATVNGRLLLAVYESALSAAPAARGASREEFDHGTMRVSWQFGVENGASREAEIAICHEMIATGHRQLANLASDDAILALGGGNGE